MEYELNIVNGTDSGFFSCCTRSLQDLVGFFNKEGRFPYSVSRSRQFARYKVNQNDDLIPLLYTSSDEVIVLPPHNQIELPTPGYWSNRQYSSEVPVESLIPFVKKYYEPSNYVKQVVADFENKHAIDYTNTIAVYYRGLDKSDETEISTYQEYIDKANELLIENPSAIFYVQSDETEFIETFTRYFPNSFVNEEMPTKRRSSILNADIRGYNRCTGIHFETPPNEKAKSAVQILSTVIVMSKCYQLILPSSNVSLWTILYRGTVKGTIQWRRFVWHRR